MPIKQKVFVVGDGAAIAGDVLCRHGIGYESIPEEETKRLFGCALRHRAYSETVSDLTLVPSTFVAAGRTRKN